MPDQVLLVEQGVDQSDAKDLGFAASGDSAIEPWLSCGEIGIDFDPAVAGGLVETNDAGGTVLDRVAQFGRYF